MPFGRIAPPYWDETPVYIIGGGPSLIGFDFSILRGLTVGVNDSAYRMQADIVVSMDTGWIEKRHSELSGDNREKYLIVPRGHIIKPEEEYQNCTYLKHKPDRRLSLEDDWIGGGNSGFAALNLAMMKQAKTIILLGFDMGTAHKTHWHGGYSWYNQDHAHYNYPRWIKDFDEAAVECIRNGITVLNANPKSLINCFTKIDLETLYDWDREEEED